MSVGRREPFPPDYLPGYPPRGMCTTFWFSRVLRAGRKRPAFPLLQTPCCGACWAWKLSMPRHGRAAPVLQTPVFRIGAVRRGRVQVALPTATSHPCVSGTRGSTIQVPVVTAHGGGDSHPRGVARITPPSLCPRNISQ